MILSHETRTYTLLDICPLSLNLHTLTVLGVFGRLLVYGRDQYAPTGPRTTQTYFSFWRMRGMVGGRKSSNPFCSLSTIQYLLALNILYCFLSQLQSVCVCVCVCACVHACVRACVCVCVCTCRFWKNEDSWMADQKSWRRLTFWNPMTYN